MDQLEQREVSVPGSVRLQVDVYYWFLVNVEGKPVTPSVQLARRKKYFSINSQGWQPILTKRRPAYITHTSSDQKVWIVGSVRHTFAGIQLKTFLPVAGVNTAQGYVPEPKPKRPKRLNWIRRTRRKR